MRVHLADIHPVILPSDAGDGQSPVVRVLESHAVSRVRYMSGVIESQERCRLGVPSQPHDLEAVKEFVNLAITVRTRCIVYASLELFV